MGGVRRWNEFRDANTRGFVHKISDGTYLMLGHKKEGLRHVVVDNVDWLEYESMTVSLAEHR